MTMGINIMGGKFSRSKGRREEQQLVLYLKHHNFKAERILRQYQEAGQADVIATKDGRTYTFEKKARKCSFKTLYQLYYEERDETGLLCFSVDFHPVAISSVIENLLIVPAWFRSISKEDRMYKVYNRIATTYKDLKQTADFLVLKDNNQPQLFLRFW